MERIERSVAGLESAGLPLTNTAVTQRGAESTGSSGLPPTLSPVLRSRVGHISSGDPRLRAPGSRLEELDSNQRDGFQRAAAYR